jgi:F-type H+-transporting ATPase subunit b
MKVLLFALALLGFADAPVWAEPPVPAHGEQDPHAEHGAHDAHGGHGSHHVAEPSPINLYNVHYGKDVHGGSLEAGEEPMAPALAFVLLNFLIFGFILVWKAGPKLTSFLDKRHNEIKEALLEAGRMREQARQKLEEYRRKVQNLDREIATIMDDIKGAAMAEKQRLLNHAKEQAEAMRRDARSRVEAEIARARAELEKEVVTRAIDNATELLQKNATAEDHNKLLANFVSDLSRPQEKRA